MIARAFVVNAAGFLCFEMAKEALKSINPQWFIFDKYKIKNQNISSNRAELFHPGFVFMQILLSNWFVNIFESINKILLLQRDIDLFFKFLQVLDVLETTLVLQLSSHGHVCCLSAYVGNICSTVALSLLDDEVQIYGFIHLHILQMDLHQLLPAFFRRQRDVNSFL